MKWENFKDYFHVSWHDKMRPFIESKECDDIYEFLKNESRRGKKLAPPYYLTYRCFELTPYTELKCVMMGMSPYHTAKNGVPVADGLLMGCSVTELLQPSLDQFYNGVEKELYNGLSLHHVKNPDVSYLAKQGVLMFNASLTTEIGKAGSHIDVWEPFTKYVIEECINLTGVPIIFLGRDAARYEKYVTPFTWTFKLLHPASASYKGTDWSTEGTFTQVNKILKDNNNYEIHWLDKMPD